MMKLSRLFRSMLVALAFVILSAAGGARAQGSRNVGIVFSAQGTPAAGANVAVCTRPALISATPCSPLAVFHTDTTLTVTAPDPLISDGLGNYHFDATPGRVGGNASVAGAFTLGSFNPSSMAASGSLTYQGGRAPQAEPQLTDAVCYVSPNRGNDANDGLSWGTAKLTVTGCWSAFPQYNPLTNTSWGGTIYITGSATTGNPLGSNVGLQIAGAGDPNYIVPSKITSLVRSGGVVTATLSVSIPSYYVNGALISVYDTQNAFTGGIGAGDPSFNGNFTLTSASGSVMTWNQTGPNSTIHGGGIILPQGWLPGADISLVCAAGSQHTANGHFPKCLANWGDLTHPSLRLSGINSPLLFQGMFFNGGQIAAQIGVDTNGSRNGTGGVAGVTFVANDFVPQSCAACGPSVDIGSNSFEIRFYDSTFSGNPNASGGVLADPFQAFVVNPGTGGGSGLIFLNNSNTNGGAIKLYNGMSGGGLYVDGLTTENNMEAAVWVVTPISSTNARVKNVEVADCSGAGGAHCYGVRVDPGTTTQNDAVIVENVVSPLAGPMICLGGCNPQGASSQVVSGLRQGQAGFVTGTAQAAGSAPAHLEGAQVDAARRGFSPVAARFAPLQQLSGGSSTNPSNWQTLQGTGTITNVAAPDGTTNAGRLTRSSGTQFQVNPCCVIVTPAVGQYYIAGVWARSQTANGFTNGEPAFLSITDSNNKFQSTGSNQVYLQQYIQGDGEWRWYYTAQKVSATDGAGANLYLVLWADATHTIDYYAPIVIQIPAGTISDNEALEYALELSTYSGTAQAGDVSMLPTQRFRMSVPGSNFQYLWNGAPTADRTLTLPDASFTVAQASQLPLSATSALIGGSSVNAGHCASGKVSVTGTTTSMAVKATPEADPGAPFIPWAFVSSANTVTVRVCNFTSTSATPTATRYNVRVIQ